MDSVVVIVVPTVLGVLLVGLTIYICVKYLKRVPPRNKYQRLAPSDRKKSAFQQTVNAPPPTIQVNTVEFTLPSGKQNVNRPVTNVEGLDHWSTEDRIYFQDQEGSLSASGVSTNFGLLKPELYGSGEESDVDEEYDLPIGNIGRIWFRLEYDCDTESLIVTLHKIHNLPARQQRSSLSLSGTSSCDPFVRVYLLPDEKRYLQSKMKRKTRSPTFKETFMFTTPYAILVDRVLRFTVFDVDRFMRQTVIGHVLYPLSKLDITMATEEFRDIVKSSQLSAKAGRLQVGLSYLPGINRVSVNVISGINIGTEARPLPDSYIKITCAIISKVHKTKRSGIQKSCNDPDYNYDFGFKVEPSNIEVASLRFEVFHTSSNVVAKDKLIGTLILGGSMVTRGSELDHWKAMISRPQTVVTEWHDLK